ncbi:AbrB family transcriptional regulator [Actibacterium pelagium]|uniref:Monooxygenase n=1 Tax=Actibacterium pelagium TaxID=2029103 RepID=A0A917ANH6_9RHOB|nr:AbrB family transcriptional regulator [Actibacterium pelagium]GGE62271.1 monooxygenase [Actibacterium pelagium]
MKNIKEKSAQLALVLGAGIAGAFFAVLIGMPIPFLIGSLLAAAIVSLAYVGKTGQKLFYPETLRRGFIAVIGTMIGSTFSPEVLQMAPILLVTLTAMAVFVVLVQGANFVIFRRLGGYDTATATYAAMPGGLIEAITLGEKAGANVEQLSMQHFVRIVVVIVSVPMLFLAVTGESVGSAAGETLERSPADLLDWVLVAVLATVGFWVGQRLRLPAAPLTGPLIITGVLQATGVIDLQGPTNLLNIAQLIVGAGLGARFSNATPSQMVRSLGLGCVSITVTLLIASALALLLVQLAPVSFQTMLISFAPGGVTEMSLIALTLNVSPVLVSAHHLARILMTVAMISLWAKLNDRP